MGDDLSRVLGPLEAEVMQVLWPAGKPLGVRAVMEKMNKGRSAPLAYTTVMTVMTRLAEKGILSRRHEGRGYLYEPAVPDAATIAVRNVVRDFGDAALSGFLDEARADPELRDRLQRLLEGDGSS
jgi:predicted transcriptional regulator